jgi:tripartite motif-containing protein 71
VRPLSAVCLALLTLAALVGAARASAPVTGALPAELSVSWQLLAGNQTLPGSFHAPGGVAVNARGDVYVADSFNFRIEKLSPIGLVVREFGTAGAWPGQMMYPSGVTVDAQGNLYVADTWNDRVQELNAAGQPVREWGEGGKPPLPGILRTPMDVAVDRQSNVYVSDEGNHRVQKFSALGVPLDAWGWNGRSRWRAGPGNLFEGPVGIALDGKGDIYVADATADRVRKLSPLGKVLATWGKRGTGPGEFREPRHLALDGDGNIYVADAGNHRVQKLSPSGRSLAQWPVGTSGDRPDGVAVAADGSVYVTDAAHDVVRKLSPQGAVVATWGRTESDAGEFAAPYGVAVDPIGRTYVVNASNAQVQVLSTNGATLTAWSTRGLASGWLGTPTSIALDPSGDLYVVDAVHHGLAKVRSDGTVVAGWPAAPGDIPRSPLGVAVDRTGNAYVADGQRSEIVELSPAGRLVRRFGAGRGKGRGQFAFSVEAPVGLAVDDSGALLVADPENGRIEKFAGTGKLLAVWGREGRRIGQLIYPAGLAVDGNGNIYITDVGNNRIQEWSKSGKPVAEWGAVGTAVGEFAGPRGIALGPGGRIFVADSDNDRIEVAVPRESAPKPLVRVSGPSPYGHCAVAPLVKPARNTEAEVRLAIDPRTAGTSHAALIGVWIQDVGLGIAGASSFDGGATWTETALPFSRCTLHGLPFQYAGDPWISIGPDGTAYAIAESVNGRRSKSEFHSTEDAIVTATSTDGGKTWTHAQAIRTLKSPGGTEADDKPTIAADPTHPGVAYALWDTVSRRGITASMAKTVDGGATWSQPSIVVPQVDFYSAAAVHQLVIDPHSDTLYDVFLYAREFPVYVPRCLKVKGRRQCHVVRESHFISYLALVRSTDGGAHWSAPAVIADRVSSIDFTYGNGVRTGPDFDVAADPHSGRLYAVWEDGRFSGGKETQTVLSFSDDGGASWTPPERLSDLPSFMPAVAVNPTGTLAVSYYAMPRRMAATRAVPAVYWLQTSRDGEHFEAPVALTGPFGTGAAPKVGPQHFIGDYQGLVADAERVYGLFVATNGGEKGNQTDVYGVVR